MISSKVQKSSQLGNDFGKLWAASSLSAIGDGVTQIAGALLVVTITSDPVLVAGLLIAQTLPWILFALPGGVFVDRFDRRRIMIGASVIRAFAVGLLAVTILTETVNLPLLYGTFFLVGCAGSMFDNASTTTLPFLVERSNLERANGRFQATKVVGEQLLARPVGGFLFALTAWVPYVVDAVGLAVIAVIAYTLPKPKDKIVSDPQPLKIRQSITEGMRWLLGHRVVRTLTLTVGLSNIGLGAVFSILVLVANERLGVGPIGYGFLLASAAIGGVAGGIGASKIVSLLGSGVTLRVGLLIEIVSYVGLIYARSIVAVVLILIVFSMHLAVFATVGASLRQSLVPSDLLGRVHSAYRLIGTAGMLAGATLGGVLSKYFGLSAPFWLGLFCSSIFTALVWRTFNNQTIADARSAAHERDSGRN